MERKHKEEILLLRIRNLIKQCSRYEAEQKKCTVATPRNMRKKCRNQPECCSVSTRLLPSKEDSRLLLQHNFKRTMKMNFMKRAGFVLTCATMLANLCLTVHSSNAAAGVEAQPSAAQTDVLLNKFAPGHGTVSSTTTAYFWM